MTIRSCFKGQRSLDGLAARFRQQTCLNIRINDVQSPYRAKDNRCNVSLFAFVVNVPLRLVNGAKFFSSDNTVAEREFLQFIAVILNTEKRELCPHQTANRSQSADQKEVAGRTTI